MSLQLAEQFEANEQYEDAYREYKEVYEQNPDDLGLLERLGHLSLILDRPEEAAGYYNEIIKRDVTNPLAYEQLMTIYENTDKYKYYIYRGNKNSIEGKLDFAISDFKKALHAASEETQIVMTRLTLANLYRQAGQTLKAIDEYNVILEYDNLHEEIFLQLADLYLQDEAYSSAIDALNRAIKKGFDTDRIHEALATVYLKSGDAKKAIEYTKDDLLKIQCMLEIGEVEEAFSKLKSLYEDNQRLSRTPDGREFATITNSDVTKEAFLVNYGEDIEIVYNFYNKSSKEMESYENELFVMSNINSKEELIEKMKEKLEHFEEKYNKLEQDEKNMEVQ